MPCPGRWSVRGGVTPLQRCNERTPGNGIPVSQARGGVSCLIRCAGVNSPASGWGGVRWGKTPPGVPTPFFFLWGVSPRSRGKGEFRSLEGSFFGKLFRGCNATPDAPASKARHREPPPTPESTSVCGKTIPNSPDRGGLHGETGTGDEIPHERSNRCDALRKCVAHHGHLPTGKRRNMNVALRCLLHAPPARGGVYTSAAN